MFEEALEMFEEEFEKVEDVLEEPLHRGRICRWQGGGRSVWKSIETICHSDNRRDFR